MDLSSSASDGQKALADRLLRIPPRSDKSPPESPPVPVSGLSDNGGRIAAMTATCDGVCSGDEKKMVSHVPIGIIPSGSALMQSSESSGKQSPADETRIDTDSAVFCNSPISLSQRQTQQSIDSPNGNLVGNDAADVCAALLKGRSAEELLAAGRAALVGGDVDSAINLCSAAVTAKLSDLPTETEISEEMGPYYLEYGSVLLRRAEESSELFKAAGIGSCSAVAAAEAAAEISNEGASSTPDDNIPGDSIPDEQLAWEVLELARMSYEKILEKADVNINDAADAVYVYLRLGDLLIGEEQFETAEKEFTTALKIVNKFGLERQHGSAVLIAQAQSQLFAGKVDTASKTFQEALELVSKLLEENQAFSSERRKDYEITKEDLITQLEEIKTQKISGFYNSSVSSADVSSSGEPSLLVRGGPKKESENPFDKPQFQGANDSTVSLGLVAGKKSRERQTLHESISSSSTTGAHPSMLLRSEKVNTETVEGLTLGAPGVSISGGISDSISEADTERIKASPVLDFYKANPMLPNSSQFLEHKRKSTFGDNTDVAPRNGRQSNGDQKRQRTMDLSESPS